MDISSYFCTEIFEIIRCNKMPKVTDTVKELILKRIKGNPEHAIFFLSDFVEITSLETIRKILSEACENGLLSHIAHGIYAKPMKSRFGEVPVPIETVAREIADRDHAQIMPTGSYAANIVGLSTQVPMVVAYLTTGSSRSVKVGNRAIRYTHAAPRNFAYRGTTIPLLVQAMKELKKENIGNGQIAAIAHFMSESSDKDSHAADLLLAPAWVRKILTPLTTA